MLVGRSFLVSWLWSRRLTEPPRPAGAWGYCEGGGFSERSPSLALPPEEQLEISLSFPSSLCTHASWARFPCHLVVVTAADRAAATCQRLSTIPVNKWETEGFQRATGKPFGRALRARNSNSWRLRRHSSPPSAEGGGPFAPRMVKAIRFRRDSILPHKKTSPQSA